MRTKSIVYDSSEQSSENTAEKETCILDRPALGAMPSHPKPCELVLGLLQVLRSSHFVFSSLLDYCYYRFAVLCY